MVINNLYIKYTSKLIFYLFLLITLFTTYELIDIDTKYVNKPSITINVNNVRNPQIKKLVRFIDNTFSIIYFKISKKKQNEFFDNNLKEYEKLNDEIIIKGEKDNLTYTNNKNFNNNKNWLRSHGNHSSNKFSNLSQINLDNVNNLRLNWEFKFSKVGAIPTNPIFFNGTIFLPSNDKSLIALNAKSGQKLWEYKTEGMAAPRGLMISEEKIPKIYFCDQYNLISLMPKNGEPNYKFGNNGKVKLKEKCHVTPVVIGKNIIIATFEPGLEVFDLKTGKLEWKLYLKEKETKYFRYGGKRHDYSGGNVWGGISADLERQIIYVSTGNAGRFYAGVNRPGKNKHSNSVVAISLKEKKIIWSFQEVEHDIWNFDIASPPILTSIERNKKKVDVVVVPTKYGNTLVLDRMTGKSLYDYKKIKVPLSEIPGEKTSFYQKLMEIPEPFSNRYFVEDHISNIFPETENYIRKKILNSTYGFFIPNSDKNKNIIYKGGAQWMGASVNNKNGTMYVTSNDIPAFIWLEKAKNKKYYNYSTHFEVIKDQYGYPGSKPPWGRLSAINLNTGKLIWSVPFGEYEELSNKGIPQTGTINYGGAVGTAGEIIFATGTLDRKIRAFSSLNGKELWNYKMDFTGSSPPTIFLHDGKQYVVVIATGSNSINDQFPNQHEFGNKVYSFSLN